ncbi:proclotting enzyme isoform X3 [Eurytemora carolleeae]|uniref:proclotting enzyme isoform X3 n=1 Tax=Eurytemora carolleeae TaxID=1294199 RepID=UPI000C786A9E|nr:proclotting enzyme isoform X3 [Eurytemora carolleeae]|eukprot:XP_023344737.1 proclotting enzyme-like isoform X3 [Eurytemora affinis]
MLHKIFYIPLIYSSLNGNITKFPEGGLDKKTIIERDYQMVHEASEQAPTLETIDFPQLKNNAEESNSKSRKPELIIPNSEDKNDEFCTCGRRNEIQAINTERISGGERIPENVYPWLVRITGGCAGDCGGSLISNKFILTAYHCLQAFDEDGRIIPGVCNHENGKRKAILGIYNGEDSEFQIVRTLTQFVFPENPGLNLEDTTSHDIAMYILADPVQFSPTIRPVCLPKFQNEDLVGVSAVAAGWGQYGVQSPLSVYPREVNLIVGTTLTHSKMFTTLVERNDDGVFKDPCAGDSGGPLMIKDEHNIYTIIGTTSGGGYLCDADSLVATVLFGI